VTGRLTCAPYSVSVTALEALEAGLASGGPWAASRPSRPLCAFAVLVATIKLTHYPTTQSKQVESGHPNLLAHRKSDL
jgi:hypothetical protein